MKKKKLIITLASIFGGVIVLSSVFAFTSRKMEHVKKDMYYEMKAFMNDSVLPVMKPLREKLDKSLSVDEKRKVEELRVIAKQLSSRHIAKHKSLISGKEKLSESEIQQIKNDQKQMRKIITQCWAILDNNEKVFDEIHADAMPKITSWKKTMKNKVGGHVPFHKSNSCHANNDHCEIHSQIPEGFVMPVLFVLYEPETNFPFSAVQTAIEKHFEE